ncbi:MAG: ABC transporter permease [Firmicutes bacterium]|jgi:peptide/nickel transport system permease protein|nr:ABC transporter permease [Bacillota bacterium]
MKKYITRKILSSLVLIVMITMVVFALTHLQPGNPYLDRLGPDMSAEQFENILRKVGYYDPLWLKYLKWAKGLVQGDLGISIKHGQPVTNLIRKYLSNSIVLISISFIISSLLGTIIGMRAGRSRGWFKKIIMSSSVALLSVPSFFVAIILMKYFAYDLKLLPSSGMYSLQLSSTATFIEISLDRIAHMILPVTVLVIMNIPAVIQFTIVNMEKEIGADYIRTAIAKGLSERVVIWKHAFKNVAVPLVALLSVQAPMIFSGAMITETIFDYPGMGKLGYDAVMARDYPLIMGVLLVNTIVVVIVNFSADFIYALLDPRIRLVKEKAS